MIAVSLDPAGLNAALDLREEEEIAGSLSSADRDLEMALVRRARTGDKAAYRTLVERYQVRAHAIAYGVIGNFDDAQDIVQDAFIKAYRNLSAFRGQSSFYTWLYRIVFNLAVDLSRKRYRKAEMSMGDSFMLDGRIGEHGVGAAASGPDEQLEKAEFRKMFREALRQLSPDHRMVIVLREVEGLSYAEISEVVGCSKGTVMSRIHHARRRLQSALREFWPRADYQIEEAEKRKIVGK